MKQKMKAGDQTYRAVLISVHDGKSLSFLTSLLLLLWSSISNFQRDLTNVASPLFAGG